MRIAYLTSQYPATSHTFIRREVTALRALGVSIDTFSVRPPGEAELDADEDRREAAATFTLLEQPVRDFLLSHLGELICRPIAYLTTFLLALRHRPPGIKATLLAMAHFAESILLATELRRRKVIHLHNHFANSGATVGLLASRHARIGWSFTIHGISEFDYPAGLLLPDKISAARFVACASYFGRAQAARVVDPGLWGKLAVVRCGLELDRLPPRGEREHRDGIRLIVVGRLSAEKGISGLLQAMAQMKSDPLPRLAIVGDGLLGPALKAQADDLGLTGRVQFLGRLPEAETLAEIARSDVLVLPSLMEGLPIVLMEALALGVPAIASRVAGIPELIKEGETGLLFSASNWPELSEALDRLAGDEALRRRLGEAGPRRIAEEFDVRASAAKLLDLFHQALSFEPTQSERPIAETVGTSALSRSRRRAAAEEPRR